MSVYVFIAVLVGSSAAAVRAVAMVYRDRLRWNFYRHIYDHGGTRHLKAAADALEDHGGDDQQNDE